MMSMFIAALIMGGIGSVHCIGMCGPLALSLPVVSNDHSSRFVSTLLYNTGRVVTYALLGAVFGLVGMSFAIFGYQQWLSLILGSLIIIFIILPKHHPVLKNNRVVLHFFEKIRSSLATLFSRKNYHSLFFIGLLNGLLPCGLVYIAIAAAVSTASIFKSSLFMAGFGLGTLPVMWSIAFFGSLVSMNMRRNIKKCYPYVMFLVGVLLVIRGLGLEIPYMSPVIGHQQKIVQCHD